METKTIDTLKDLLEVYEVEIPIVQRDYAQGRQDEHAKLVRENLLQDMKAAVLGEGPLDLNFVYGKAEGKKFIPLDGQQRLTTLFLLHVYAFAEDEGYTNLLKRFTYKTRKSSRDFLEKLVENRKEIFESNSSPSEEIEDSPWFLTVWKYDPTIQSVCNMLDAIKQTFEDVENLRSKLSDANYKPIVFNFLDMNHLDMEDSLYIKLNARGKALSRFENFKARLIGSMQKLKLSFSCEFERSLDGSWTDLFWSQGKESFDRTYLNFFGVLFMNQGIYINTTNWSDTLVFEKIDEGIFKKIFYVLNFLVKHSEETEIKDYIFNALKEKSNYKDKVLFHAVTTYFYKSKGIKWDSFKQWLRIIRNLTLNSQIDTEKTYRGAIEEINELAKEWDDLLDYFSGAVKVKVFSQEQIKEEQDKARIILKDKEFAKAIYAAESHPYFNGQIRSALYRSKEGETYNLNTFKKYWNKIEELFDDKQPEYNHLLRRALLTIGDYTLPVSKYKTLCVDDPNEGASTPSLKRLLASDSEIVTTLLDKLNENEDIKVQMENIIQQTTVPENDWRYCFINYPQLFNRMSSSHLRLRQVGKEVIIIPNKSSNGFNDNPYLCVLEILLREKNISAEFGGGPGAAATQFLKVKQRWVSYEAGEYRVVNEEHIQEFNATTNEEIVNYLVGC